MIFSESCNLEPISSNSDSLGKNSLAFLGGIEIPVSMKNVRSSILASCLGRDTLDTSFAELVLFSLRALYVFLRWMQKVYLGTDFEPPFTDGF